MTKRLKTIFFSCIIILGDKMKKIFTDKDLETIKNTTLKTNKRVYIVCGKARNGKDTICSLIEKIYNEKNKAILNLQYSSYIKMYAKTITNWDGSEETKPRALLQMLGTDIIRKKIDELLFVNRAVEDIKVYSYFYDAITISDARTKTEVDIPKNKLDNIISIKVIRPNFDNGLTIEQKNHFTEIDLDDYDKFDHIVYNDGTIEELEEKIRKIVDIYEH